jgi:hypothetical protein
MGSGERQTRLIRNRGFSEGYNMTCHTPNPEGEDPQKMSIENGCRPLGYSGQALEAECSTTMKCCARSY